MAGDRQPGLRRAVTWTILAALGVVLSAGGALPARFVGEGVVDDHGAYYPPAMTKPAVGASYVDPVFGTRVTRLTDDGATFNTGAVSPEYAQISAFNQDDSYLILRPTNGDIVLHDGAGNFLRSIDSPYGTAYEPRWSRINPQWLYYHTQARRGIYRYDIGANTHTLVADYSVAGQGKSRVCNNRIDFGRGQSDISDNERINITCDGRYLMVVDLQTGTDFGVGDAQSGFDSVTIAMDGESVAVSYDNAGSSRFQGFEQWSKEGQFMVQLMHSGGHLAMARDVDGTAVMVVNNANSDPQQPAAPNSDWNGIVKISLDGNATRTLLIGLIGVANNCCASELFAGRSGDGWVYIGTYRGYQPSQSQWLGYDQEIFRIRLDPADGHGEARVERLLHHRSTTVTYYATPLLSVSQTGKKLVFPSDFGNASGRIDTYMIELEGAGNTPTAPAAPSSLQAVGLADPRVDLSWQDNADNEDSFEVLRQGPGESSPRFLTFLGANATGYQDHDVVAAQQYCYQVIAHGAAASSPPSNTACATPASAPVPPAAPTELQAVGSPEPRIDLSWRDNSAAEDSFEVRRKGPGDTVFWPIAVVNAEVTSYGDRAVSADDEFCYQVMAQNGIGESPPSGVSCATPPAPSPPPPPAPAPAVPAAPSDLQVQVVGRSLVRLTWSDNSDNEDGFEIHRRRSDRSYRRIGSVAADVISFDDGRASRKRSYCYRVFAKNDIGRSVSNEVCVQAHR